MHICVTVCAMKTKNKVRFALYLSEDQLGALGKISEETGAPVAELIRRAIASWLQIQKQGHKK
jgi:Ribbon-helix-helix domain